jgi:hypothetical protein
MVYPMGGTVDRRQGDHVLLAPPSIATHADLERIAGLLAEAIGAAIQAELGLPKGTADLQGQDRGDDHWHHLVPPAARGRQGP